MNFVYANRTTKTPSKHKPAAGSAPFESLEGRRLMSASSTVGAGLLTQVDEKSSETSKITADVSATPNRVKTATNPVSITVRYGNELVITAAGTNDSVLVTESGSTLTIVADGRTSADAAPAAGLFVYTRGGKDSINIGSSVTTRTTIDSVDNAVTTVSATGTDVIAWVDSKDIVTGTAAVHSVANFAGGVSKALGKSLANPSDSGYTTRVNLSLFGTGPVAGDINQGETGDCYFLSSLAAFANQHPSVILNSAVDLGDGTYAVQFEQHGKPAFVRVNNSFPTGGFGGYMFAQPGANHTIWAVVMEKAFAYFRTRANTYDSISGGWMSEVYADLGVASADFTPSYFSDQDLFSALTSDLKAGDAVTLATSDWAPDMVQSHAYTLVGTKKVKGVDEYIVRNPWGVSGDYLENSQGIAVLNYVQVIENYELGTVARS